MSASSLSKEIVRSYAGDAQQGMDMRAPFETFYRKLMEQPSGTPFLEGLRSENCLMNPVYGIVVDGSHIKNTIVNCNIKLFGSYENNIFIVLERGAMSRCTFSPGDSTLGGLLNSEGNSVFNIANDPQQLKYSCKNPQLLSKYLDNLSVQFPSLNFTQAQRGAIFFKPKIESYFQSIMTVDQGIDMNSFVEGLKIEKLLESHDYVESQIPQKIVMKKVSIVLNKTLEPLFEDCLKYLKDAHHPLASDLQKMIEKRSIFFAAI